MSIRLPEIFLYPLFLLLVTAVPGFAQTADFSASPVSGCSPLVVNFTDLSTGGPVSTYSWNLGNSVTSTLQHPSTTYTSPGTYSVTLTVTGPGGSSTKTISVIVFDQPAVSFSATTALTGCTPHYVQFSSTVTPNSPGTVIYNWDFGDGTTGTGANPDHMYNTAGVYTVLLSVTNGAGCATTIAQNAYITAYPVVNGGFSASQTYFCSLPATATFTNTSTGGTPPFTTSWDFGDGTTGSGNAAPHTYTTSGSFTVTMITTDARGCSDTVVKASYITVIGTLPTFISPPAVCERVKATFINNTMGYSATSWDFGDGDVDLTSNIADHAYMVAGTYNVTMTTVIAGCTKTLTKPIQIDPKPRSTVTMTPPVPCPPPVTVSFSANSVVPSTTGYDWSWLNGGTASGQTVNKFYPANIPGFHHDAVTLITTSAAGCRDTLRIDTVYIRDILVGALPGGSVCNQEGAEGCFPLTHVFSHERLKSSLPPNPSPGCNPAIYPYDANSWLWDFDDGSPLSTQATPTHTFPVAGDYRVKVIITTPNGCIDSGFTNVHTDTIVHPSFTASPLSVCQNSLVTYVNTTANILSGTKFQWIVADAHGERDSTVRPLPGGSAYTMIREPGPYDVWLYSDNDGCVDSAVKFQYIEVHPPDARFIDSSFCAPSYTTVKFINTSVGPTSWFWKFGDGDTSTAFSPTHTYPGLGHYFVTLIVHNNIHDCYDTLVKRIQLFVPTFDFKATDSSICPNEYVQFEASYIGDGQPYYSFYSNGVTTAFDTLPQAIFRYPNRGYHDVTMYLASGNGCIDTLTKPTFIRGWRYGNDEPGYDNPYIYHFRTRYRSSDCYGY